jgi:hypothetical protein
MRKRRAQKSSDTPAMAFPMMILLRSMNVYKRAVVLWLSRWHAPPLTRPAAMSRVEPSTRRTMGSKCCFFFFDEN